VQNLKLQWRLQHDLTVPDLINSSAQASSFIKYWSICLYTVLLKLFSQLIGGCLGVIVYIQTVSIAKELLIATGSSAGVERIFSSFGLVHSKLRNSLGIVKAENWCFCSNCWIESHGILMMTITGNMDWMTSTWTYWVDWLTVLRFTINSIIQLQTSVLCPTLPVCSEHCIA